MANRATPHPVEAADFSGSTSSAQTPAGWRGVLNLCLCLLGIVFLWGGVFPALSRHPYLREKIDKREEQGIELGAMYYTELERMTRTGHPLEQLKKQSAENFWTPR